TSHGAETCAAVEVHAPSQIDALPSCCTSAPNSNESTVTTRYAIARGAYPSTWFASPRTAGGAVSIAAVLAQITQNPAAATPTLNDGGWVYNAAILLAALGILVLLLHIFVYMQLAPRFQTDEGERRRVKAPRLEPGKDVRRPVNVV